MKYKLLALIVAFSAFHTISAQIIKPVKWTYSTRDVDATHTELVFKAALTSPWHMYGLNIPEGGPIPVSITFENEQGFVTVGKPSQSPKPEIVDDKIFKMMLELHSGQVTFIQRIRKTTNDSIIIRGVVEYMTCSDVQCIPGDEEFEIKLKGLDKPITAGPVESSEAPSALTPDAVASEDSSIVEKDTMLVDQTALNDPKANKSPGSPRKSLWGVFFLAMVAGLGGLLTPCVYPMIPMTVSYFLRNDKPRSRAISEAIVFGLSMVMLYTLIGVLVAIFKNPNAVNDFTTHWITNLVFFSIFIVLAASFFGMFEIMLPSGLANSVDKQADKGGYIGAFFMAVAMAILSFSCTGPIVASLLIKASQGEVLEPVIGMAGFSLVFALPFTLFAIFPSWLQGLPKSGAWLNGIKVFFAFIMLAFSLYFLSKIDQAYHLNLISRSVFLSAWIVIFTLMGLYFLGKIKFAHDSPVSHLSVPRLLLTIISFSFALYLFTGLLGNDLKGLSTILPTSENKTRTTFIQSSANNDHTLCDKPKYSDFLSLPNGINGYFDYNEALACAKEQNKPVLVDFVGHTCSNCKKMYAEVWSDPRVIKLLNEKFIVVALYTDDKTKLPKEEWIESTDGRVKSTIGKKNQELQVARFNSNALPLYAIVDGEGNDLSSTYYSYDPDIEKFLDWLENY